MTEIDYAIQLNAGGTGSIFENGTSRGTYSYAVGDVFAVEASSAGTVRYYQNGLLLYTSGVSPTYPLLVDTAAHGADSKLVDVSVGGLIMPRVATPTFSPVAGTYTSAQTVTISCATGSATIRYTTDGTEPTTASTTYTGTLNIATTTTLKAKAWKTGYDASATATATYQMNFGTLAAPTFTPAPGTYTSSATVTMSSTQSGATIRYTTNGSEPTASSTAYTAPLLVDATTTLKAKAFHIDYVTSATTTGTYTIVVAEPTFTPDGGSHAAGTTITVATATSGATIRYTLTGVDPTTSDTVIASGGTLVVGNYTLKAKAFKAGCTDSTTKSASYTMTGVFTPGALVGGTSHVLALRHDGTVWAWGSNGTGRLGDGTTTTAMRPIRVAGLTGVTAIAAGGSFSMALRNDGTVWTWGSDTNGELGNGAAGATNWPTPISLTNVTHIAAGASHALARKSDGTVVAWGLNGSGRLGDGTTTTRTSPVAVTDLAGVAAVAAGSEHSAAVLSNGTVKAWGANNYSQVGDGTTTDRWTATTVDGLYSIATLAAGSNHTVALSDDGRVWVWGSNINGQFGDGTEFQRTTPVQAAILGVTSVAATNVACYAVKSDGTLWTWGDRTFGALGDGQTSGSVRTPTQVAGVSGVAAVGAGQSYLGLARTTDRKVLAWGNNGTTTVVGDGTAISRTTPTEVAAADFDWKVATPTLMVGSAPYGALQTVNVTSNQSVTIANQTGGSTIYYTTNGVDPTTSDAPVSGAVVISDSTTLKARAYQSGVPTSNVDGVIFAYKVATPTFSPAPATYSVSKNVTISCSTSGATIRYTTDGSEPTSSSTLYSVAVTISTETTLKARAFKGGWTDSDTASGTYFFNYGTGSTPSISPAAGSYVDTVSVSISGGPSGATIRYTTNGSTPDANSTLYTGAFNVTSGLTVKARAFHPDYVQSAVASNAYTIQLSTPSLSPGGGTYSVGQQVTISTTTSGATLRYTLGGVNPTTNDPVIESGTVVTLLATATIKVKAFKSGYTDSAVASATYTITGSPSVAGTLAPSRWQSSYATRSSDTTMWDWGYNSNKQLGDGTTNDAPSPMQVTAFGTVTAMAGGQYHAVALRSDGLVYAAGLNTTGQLGDGTTTARTNPVQVINLTSVTAVGAGNTHGLAVTGGSVKAWGDNSQGQLGDNTTTSPRSTAVQAQGLTSGVVAVTGGALHSLALKSDGTVWAWGDNASGQLGDSSTTDRKVPTQVSGISTATAIAAGASSSYALLSDGTVKAWGRNTSYELGDGSTTNRTSPVTVTGLAGVRAIAAGEYHALAARADGSVVSWGSNGAGQLGDTGSPRPYAGFVYGPSGIVAVAAGSVHSLALANDGTVWGWGGNSVYQLGDGTTTGRPPIKLAEPVMSWKAPTPVLSVGTGTYTAEQAVALNSTLTDSLVHYTTNGADPTGSDSSVSPGGTVNVTTSQTLKARTFKSGWSSSNLASADYTLQVPVVSFSLTQGTYNTDQSLTLSSGLSGVTIRYTTDGTTPTGSSTAYNTPLSIGATQTVKAIGWRSGWTESVNDQRTYTMKVAVPAPSPTPGSHTSPPTVTLTTTTSGTTIHYTVDGSEPNESRPSMSSGGTVAVGQSSTLAAMARRAGWTNSDVFWGFYSISLGTVATPTISPAAATYTAVQSATISTTTVGATIRYTTDGTDPTLWSSVYTGPIAVDATMTVKAKAFKEDHTASAIGPE